MKEKFYLLGFLIIIGFSLESKAQVSYNKRALGSIGNAPKTGDFLNAASLDNVDMTTGTLKIGIPLYEIKVNDIVVPISLSYNATGLKVGQEASSVGMGWELKVGGKIVRNIQGKEDLSTDGIASNPLPEVTSLDPFNNSTHRTIVGNILDGKKDSGWDTYTYSLPNGMGGTFLKNGLTFPYDPLITIVHPGLIKTTDGLEYNFTLGTQKESKRKVDYYRDMIPITQVTAGQEWNQDPPVVSRDWDLSTIISKKFNDTVSFGYQSLNYPNAKLVPKTRNTFSESLPLFREVRARSFIYGGVVADPQDQFYLIQDPIISQSRTETTIHTRLTTVDFPNGNVTFVYATNDIAGQDVLQRIDINQKIKGVTTLLKRYVFEYDNADQNYGHYLIALHSYDKTNTWQSAYDFTYEGKMPVVPNTGSMAQDSWGFYNGQESNKTLLDNPGNVLALKTRAHYPIRNNQLSTDLSITYSRSDAMGLYGFSAPGFDPISGENIFSIPFADRSYNFTHAIKGTLKSVKTPTGGIYEYEYEPHKFLYVSKPTSSTAVNVVEAGGGIRIKSITKKLGHDSQYDGLTNIEKSFKKKYEYGMGEYSSSGSTIETSGYGVVTTPGVVLGNKSRFFDAAYPITVVNNIMLLSHPVNNLVQYGGSFGAYKSVTEYLMKDDVSATYGKTVYYSKLFPDINAPDAEWNPYTATMENHVLPLMCINAGVTRDFGLGIIGIKKYTYKGSYYQTSQETLYTFKSFDAPLNSTNKLVNFYGTLTGQMSGPFHGGGPVVEVRDDPYQQDRGGTILNLFNKVNSVGTGRMDYIAATNTVSEDKTANFSGKYQVQLLDLNTLSNVVKKESEHNIVIATDGYTSQVNNTKYYYDNALHLLPTRIATKNSMGDSVITRMKYPQDYSSPSNAALIYMKANKVGLTEVIDQFSTFKKGSTEYVREATINDFKLQFGAILDGSTSKMKIGSNVPFTSTITSTGVFTPEVSYDFYIKGQVHQYKDLSGASNVVLWGYNNQYPVAKVNNAITVAGYQGYYLSADVAYTSFEHSDVSNWTYSGTPIADASSPSGKFAYSLGNGSITKSTYTPSASKYIISYWYKSGASVNVTGGTVGAAVVKRTYGSWTLAEREISSASGTITVSGTGSIDELRFHPIDSQMTTYVYDPLIGITCVMDSKGSAQYYEYDESQRLKNVKDQQGNIVKSHQYIMGILN